MEIKTCSVNKVIPYTNNPRKNDAAVEAVAESIRQCGYCSPIVVDEDMVILAGHTRLKAIKSLGWDKCEVVIKEGLTEEQKKKYRILDNKTNELAEWDFEKLDIELQDIDFDGFDFGFDIEEKQTEAVDDDYKIEAPEEPKAKLGDIYKLGRHRLMCGDSTDVKVIDRLMDGVKANLLLTDPPYGITAVEWDADIDLHDMWATVDNSTSNKACKLVFSAQPFTTRLIQSNEKKFRYEIIWVKTQKTGFYNANRMPLKMHENIIVFYDQLPTYNPQKETIERNDIGRKRIKKADRCALYGHVNAQDYIEDGTRFPADVIQFSNWNGALFGNNDNATLHSTQKPVELLAYLIKTYSNDSESVLDLFGGSGSTLIACEQLNRKCYMCELDPHYVDVIIDRWEKFTGEKAELIRGE